MNLHLQPTQFLFLYNSLKRLEKEFMDPEEEEVFISTKQLLENVILGAFEDIEVKALSSGFDKWVKSEKNKIQGLEEELKKIKEVVPQEVLIGKLTPVEKEKEQLFKPLTKGRPKKRK